MNSVKKSNYYKKATVHVALYDAMGYTALHVKNSAIIRQARIISNIKENPSGFNDF